jgi:thiosulfate dehydrogenase
MKAPATLLALTVAAAACSTPREEHAAAPAAPHPKVALVVPPESSIPSGPEGDLIRRGRTLATRTKEEMPDRIGADMHCTSCHLAAGTTAFAGPWVGVTSIYPQYRARAGREVTIEDRIDSCVERSLDGKALAHDAPEMKALVAYMTWLSKDVPKGSEVEGRGFKRLERPPNVDPESGAQSFAARCATCHGADGQGKRAPDGSYQFPPLWGERSFNIGAGMGRLDTAAAFVKQNMPLGSGGTLTTWEAYDIAAYFTEQARPDFARKAGDWPKGGKPSDARY